ncbi:hypothetical protein TNCV_3388591 [Trichonephila clavipes]|nr:hypothetical protein TNCV_3388591 [Trichonephila clavipes]
MVKRVPAPIDNRRSLSKKNSVASADVKIMALRNEGETGESPGKKETWTEAWIEAGAEREERNGSRKRGERWEPKERRKPNRDQIRRPKVISLTKGETMNVCGVGELETTS